MKKVCHLICVFLTITNIQDHTGFLRNLKKSDFWFCMFKALDMILSSPKFVLEVLESLKFSSRKFIVSRGKGLKIV